MSWGGRGGRIGDDGGVVAELVLPLPSASIKPISTEARNGILDLCILFVLSRRGTILLVVGAQ